MHLQHQTLVHRTISNNHQVNLKLLRITTHQHQMTKKRIVKIKLKSQRWMMMKRKKKVSMTFKMQTVKSLLSQTSWVIVAWIRTSSPIVGRTLKTQRTVSLKLHKIWVSVTTKTRSRNMIITGCSSLRIKEKQGLMRRIQSNRITYLNIKRRIIQMKEMKKRKMDSGTGLIRIMIGQSNSSNSKINLGQMKVTTKNRKINNQTSRL